MARTQKKSSRRKKTRRKKKAGFFGFKTFAFLVVLGAAAGYFIGTALWEEKRDGDTDDMGGAGNAMPTSPFVVVQLSI